MILHHGTFAFGFGMSTLRYLVYVILTSSSRCLTGLSVMMDIVSRHQSSQLTVSLTSSKPRAVFAHPVPPPQSVTPNQLYIGLLMVHILVNMWRLVLWVAVGISVSRIIHLHKYGAPNFSAWSQFGEHVFEDRPYVKKVSCQMYVLQLRWCSFDMITNHGIFFLQSLISKQIFHRQSRIRPGTDSVRVIFNMY